MDFSQITIVSLGPIVTIIVGIVLFIQNRKLKTVQENVIKVQSAAIADLKAQQEAINFNKIKESLELL